MDIESVDPRDWAIAQRRAEILSKLPERPSGAQIRDAMAALERFQETSKRPPNQFFAGSAAIEGRADPRSATVIRI